MAMNLADGFYPEVLPEEQQRLLRRLGPAVQRRGFYLAGGTALAIQLGHRRSLDLDWFTREALDRPDELELGLGEEGFRVAPSQIGRGSLHGVLDLVKVSFLSYRYPLLQPPVDWKAFGCSLASLEDLACMKLVAVAQRGLRRDFIDIFALSRHLESLARMFDLYRTKYRTHDVGHLVAALSYFDDAEQEPMPAMLWEEDWTGIKTGIRDLVRQFVR